MSPKTENLNYKSSVLIEKFSYYRKPQHHDEAAIDGRSDSVTKPLSNAKRIIIANKIYGSDGNPNGNTQPGDGWKFRGHGFFQLTGYDNYHAFNKEYAHYWNGNVDFISNPDLVMQFPYSLRSAVWFWIANNCVAKADQGVNDAAINAVTHKINSGMDGAKERRDYVKVAYAAFK
ncbi:glycoside hydrolase family 19 protein [Sulfuriferula thiophila]|uniref:glycoside hydrolase family 19 protein n=1 Tax=Sulfuriferula thiophila TaxID=1781211 RepID=UPI000F61283C|nr:hypothetical protein [Sulfuriferula thiophila]